MGSNWPLITCLIILFVFANTRPSSCEGENDPIRERYEKWMVKNGRTHKDANQREKRFQIYKANVELIDAYNSVNKEYKLTDNKFADLTNIEFREHYMGLRGNLDCVPLLVLIICLLSFCHCLFSNTEVFIVIMFSRLY